VKEAKLDTSSIVTDKEENALAQNPLRNTIFAVDSISRLGVVKIKFYKEVEGKRKRV